MKGATTTWAYQMRQSCESFEKRRPKEENRLFESWRKHIFGLTLLDSPELRRGISVRSLLDLPSFRNYGAPPSS